MAGWYWLTPSGVRNSSRRISLGRTGGLPPGLPGPMTPPPPDLWPYDARQPITSVAVKIRSVANGRPMRLANVLSASLRRHQHGNSNSNSNSNS
jgi:hypothetical protein